VRIFAAFSSAGVIGIVLEPPDQKVQDFLVPVALKLLFVEHAPQDVP
jgi:hypothetical protein